MPELNIAELARIHASQLLDFSKQGASSRMKEVKGKDILAKEIPVRNPQEIEAFGNEMWVGGALNRLRYARGPEFAKPAVRDTDGAPIMRAFIKRINGNEVVVPNQQEELLRFGIEIATKLTEIEAMRIVLVDIKPENIMFNGTECILVDFGTAVRSGDRALGCTAEYTSPDVYLDDIDSRHDTYCLAAIMAEAVLGRSPNDDYPKNPNNLPIHTETIYQKLQAEIIARCQPNTRLGEIIADGLQLDRNKRPRVHEFAQQLEEISPRFRTFPTLREAFINRIRTAREVGEFLADLEKSMMSKRADIPIKEMWGDYLEGTNFDFIGIIIKSLELATEQAKQTVGQGGDPSLFRRRYLGILSYTKQSLKGEEYQQTPREREAIRLVLLIYKDLSHRIISTRRPDKDNADFTYDCLNILIGKRPRGLWQDDPRMIRYEEVLAGYQKRKKELAQKP